MRMQRGVLAGVIAATLLIPAVGTIAGPREEKRRTEATLEQIEADLDRQTAQASNLQDEVDALDASIRSLQIEMRRLDEEVEEVRAEVRDTQGRIDDTQGKIDRIQQAAVDQAVSLYKSGQTDAIDVLLHSETLAELDARVEMLGAAARQSTGTLVRFGRLKVTMRHQQDELFDQRDKLQAKLDDRTEVAAQLAGQRQRFNEKLALLEGKIARNQQRKSHHEGRLEDLTQQILEAQAKSAVAALGTSKKGFIWPLNGPVTSYYGPRWGRMHTGIDINGYTGQPIVAAKEGQVVMASSYSGYGNAVVIDHGGGYATLYGHLSGFNTSNGAYVDQGDVIGYVGCTGSCTGDHLHFEVRVNGEPVDPMPYLP